MLVYNARRDLKHILRSLCTLWPDLVRILSVTWALYDKSYATWVLNAKEFNIDRALVDQILCVEYFYFYNIIGFPQFSHAYYACLFILIFCSPYNITIGHHFDAYCAYWTRLRLVQYALICISMLSYSYILCSHMNILLYTYVVHEHNL